MVTMLKRSFELLSPCYPQSVIPLCPTARLGRIPSQSRLRNSRATFAKHFFSVYIWWHVHSVLGPSLLPEMEMESDGVGHMKFVGCWPSSPSFYSSYAPLILYWVCYTISAHLLTRKILNMNSGILRIGSILSVWVAMVLVLPAKQVVLIGCFSSPSIKLLPWLLGIMFWYPITHLCGFNWELSVFRYSDAGSCMDGGGL